MSYPTPADITGLAVLAAETLIHHGQDPRAAAQDPELLHAWEEAEPETRAALLVSHAWETRTGTPPPIGDTQATMYAASLHTYASEHTGTPAEFTGENWPAMPLPGTAGELASSLAFDRDDTGTSLETLLLLTASRTDKYAFHVDLTRADIADIVDALNLRATMLHHSEITPLQRRDKTRDRTEREHAAAHRDRLETLAHRLTETITGRDKTDAQYEYLSHRYHFSERTETAPGT